MKSRRDLIARSRQTSGLAKRERQRIFFRIAGVIFCALFFGGLAVWGLNQDAVRIQRVAVRGNSGISSTTLSSMMTESLAGAYAFLVPKDTVLFYPRQIMIANVLSAYPQIKKAEVTTENFDTLVLSVEERTSQFVWCDPSAAIDAAGEAVCYFADTSGYIFDHAPSFSNPVFFEVKSPLVDALGASRSGAPIGGFVLSEEALKKLLIFKDRLSIAGIETIALHVFPGGDYELRIKNGGKILFNGKQNFDTVLENLNAALHASDLNKALAGASLQYIDLRFGNKVFYKLTP